MKGNALKGCFFNGFEIRLPKTGPCADSPDAPGSWPVAVMRTDLLSLATDMAATGQAMAAAGEMLEVLQLVAKKLESRPYGTGSYLPKPIRDQVHAVIAKATGQEGGAA